MQEGGKTPERDLRHKAKGQAVKKAPDGDTSHRESCFLPCSS